MDEKATFNEEFIKEQRKQEMRHQVLTFSMLIIFTIISFGMVMSDLNAMFVRMTILLFAAVQVGFQLYYFMHMSEKGHGMPSLLFYGGCFAGFLTVLGLVVLTWW